MTIAQVSEKYGLSEDTLRYYERAGLIPPVPRRAGGARDYDEAACGWVEFAKCFRAAGIGVEALAEYVRLWQQGSGTAAARKALLVRERAALAARMAAMRESLTRLDAKIAGYEELLAPAEAELRRLEQKRR